MSSPNIVPRETVRKRGRPRSNLLRTGSIVAEMSSRGLLEGSFAGSRRFISVLLSSCKIPLNENQYIYIYSYIYIYI